MTSPTYTIGHRYRGRRRRLAPRPLPLRRRLGGRVGGPRAVLRATRSASSSGRRRARDVLPPPRFAVVARATRASTTRRITVDGMLILAFDTATDARRARSSGTARCSASSPRGRSRVLEDLDALLRRGGVRDTPGRGHRRRHRAGELHRPADGARSRRARSRSRWVPASPASRRSTRSRPALPARSGDRRAARRGLRARRRRAGRRSRPSELRGRGRAGVRRRRRRPLPRGARGRRGRGAARRQRAARPARALPRRARARLRPAGAVEPLYLRVPDAGPRRSRR